VDNWRADRAKLEETIRENIFQPFIASKTTGGKESDAFPVSLVDNKIPAWTREEELRKPLCFGAPRCGFYNYTRWVESEGRQIPFGRKYLAGSAAER
jgi:hypothetical protein